MVSAETPATATAGGRVDSGYETVQRVFTDSLPELGGGGGAFAAYVDGRPVVDVWGGCAGPDTPWAEDTLVVVVSPTKGLVTVCAHCGSMEG